MQEELHVAIEPQFFKTYIHEEPWGVVERNIFYGIVTTSKRTLKSALIEGDDVDFFSYEEMQSLSVNKNHLAIVNEFLASHS